MSDKIKTLIWEECRVGGVLTATLGALCFGFIIWGRLDGNVQFVERGFSLRYSFVLAPALLGAILLVLNPNYSGHLSGGFPERIMRLPVRTGPAVGVALTCRMAFVSLLTFICTVFFNLLFENDVTWFAPGLVAGIYLVCQLIDWTRNVYPRAIMVFFGVPFIVAILAYAFDSSVRQDVSALLRQHTAVMLLGFLLYGPVYACSMVAVHRARVGRGARPRLGTWLSRFTNVLVRRRVRDFDSPIAAQIWYEGRRAALPLTLLTVTLWVAFCIPVYFFSGKTGNQVSLSNTWLQTSFAYLGYAALLFAAAAYGTQTSILGYRRVKGLAGYTYLQPMSTAEMAMARLGANALALTPALVVATLGHYVLGSGTLFTELVPAGIREGMISFRESLWLVLSRPVLFGVVAWVLTVVGSRLFIFVLPCALGAAILFESAGDFQSEWSAACVLGIFVVGAYGYALRLRLISIASCMRWAILWIGIAVLIHAPIRDLIDGVLWRSSSAAASLAFAALVPMPYIAILLDMANRRHGAMPTQSKAPRFIFPWQAQIRVLSIALAAGLIWFAWPAEPTYREYLRAAGHPATLAELDESYPHVPDEENRALDFVAVSEAADVRNASFISRHNDMLAEFASESDRKGSYAKQRSRAREEILAKNFNYEDSWVAEYWESVIRPTSDEMKALPLEEKPRSRYPVDLHLGYQAPVEYLWGLNNLCSDLEIDANIWMGRGNMGEALHSIELMFALCDSLRDEPMPTSQNYRAMMLRRAIHTTVRAANATACNADDLAQLKAILERERDAEAMAYENVELALYGELVMSLAEVNFWALPYGQKEEVIRPSRLISLLALPRVGEEFLTTRWAEAIKSTAQISSYQESERIAADRADRFRKPASLFAPLVQVRLQYHWADYGHDWRTRTHFDTSYCAIAVAEYQKAHGRFPERLEDLVPKHLEVIPRDYFSSGPLRYAINKRGAAVIHSVGDDGIPDKHEIVGRKAGNNDDTAYYIEPAQSGT